MRGNLTVRGAPVCCLQIFLDDPRKYLIKNTYLGKIIPGSQDSAFIILNLLRFRFLICGQILFHRVLVVFQNQFLANEHGIDDAAEALRVKIVRYTRGVDLLSPSRNIRQFLFLEIASENREPIPREIADFDLFLVFV